MQKNIFKNMGPAPTNIKKNDFRKNWSVQVWKFTDQIIFKSTWQKQKTNWLR